MKDKNEFCNFFVVSKIQCLFFVMDFDYSFFLYYDNGIENDKFCDREIEFHLKRGLQHVHCLFLEVERFLQS